MIQTGDRVLITDDHLPHCHIWIPYQEGHAKLIAIETSDDGVCVAVHQRADSALVGWFKREWLYLPHDYEWAEGPEETCRRCGFYGPDNDDDPDHPLPCPGGDLERKRLEKDRQTFTRIGQAIVHEDVSGCMCCNSVRRAFDEPKPQTYGTG